MHILQKDSKYHNAVSLVLVQTNRMALNVAKTYAPLVFAVNQPETVEIVAEGVLNRELPWTDVPSDLEIEKTLAEYAYSALATV